MSITNPNQCTVGERLAPDTILQSRYRITRHVGRGGMGTVYEAIDLRLGHTVALKQALTGDEELWKQFEREARLMARLNHSVLPSVSDYFTEGNCAFFVMQFVEGIDLAEIIAQQPGPFPRNAVVAWADQLLDALIYLHSRERQIIHRDIKPHNLKITPSGRIALLDFGLAKTQSADPSADNSCPSVFGYTPRYAPLEQIQDMGTSPQSDIYALGATLYHLLTGVKPPDALTRAAALVSSRPNPLLPANEINGAVGEELSAILNRAMAQNPDERYRSAAEFRTALARVGRIEVDTPTRHARNRFEVELTTDDAGDTTVVAVDHARRISKTEEPANEAVGRSRDLLYGEVLGLSEAAPIELVVRPDENPSCEIVSAGETFLKARRGSRSIAALFVILISSFGVFCHYYPWKLPPLERDMISAPQPSVSNSESYRARTKVSASRKHPS